MGALHQGHGSLIARAALPGHFSGVDVLVSVFINPLQFGPGEDFASYPRDLEEDVRRAGEAGATALFAPSVEEVFPGGSQWITRVEPADALRRELCGRSRSGHFEGVATVVCRLLALVRPHLLLLGEKDWQQLVILRRTLRDLAVPVSIRGCATVRESDGLACSSRNRYLSVSERRRAAALPAALGRAREQHRQSGRDIPADTLTALVRTSCQESGLDVEYVQLVEAHTLRPLQNVTGLSLLAAAVRCGPSRLIDHVFLMSRSPIVAVDGPAGAGKSTVTRAFARRVGLLYLDTGAMYRAVTWWVLQQGADPADPEAVAPLLQDLRLQLGEDPEGRLEVRVNGRDVSEAIRGPDVTALVSTVAAHAAVREALTLQQRAMGERGGLVAEGRDIGTAVFPDAECKVFLTASVEERARRRAGDLRQRGYPVPSLRELEAQIAERDRLDAGRAVAPLRQAEDAAELITDAMTIEEVIEAMVDLFRARVPEDAWPDPIPTAPPA
jgi:pantoate ligase/cytidylate kinase